MDFDLSFLGLDMSVSEEDVIKMFRMNDITVMPPVFDKSAASTEDAEKYKRIRKITKRVWREQRRKLGDTSVPENYNGDQFPAALIANADIDLISGCVLPVLKELEKAGDDDSAPEEADDFEPTDPDEKALFELIGSFILSAGKDYESAVQAYAAEHEKTAEDLTDEELRQILDDIAESLLEKEMQMIDCGQNISAILQLARQNPAHEDFSGKPENHAKIDFERKFYHTRSNTTVSNLSEITETNEDGEEIIPDFPDGESFTGQAELRADMLSVLMTLDETDRKIIDLRMEDLTQEQIAAQLQMTQSAVSKRLKKLEKKFAEFRS